MSLRPSVHLNSFRGHRLTSAPASEPVVAADVKEALVLSGSSDDDLITDFIAEARVFFEAKTSLALITQTWTLVLDEWPGYKEPWWDGVRQGAISLLDGEAKSVHLPRTPVQSVSSVTTYDGDSNSTSVTVADVFDVDTYQGRMSLQQGAVWPSATRPTNAIEIAYIAGYGANAADVPAPIGGAIRDMAAYKYEHRGCMMDEAFMKSGAMEAAGLYGELMI